MPVEIVMPQLGLTMTEGKVLRWCKQVGESFESGEPLFEVETDKVNMEVEATEAGTLVEAAEPSDDPLPVSTIIGRYLRPGEAPGVVPAATTPAAVETPSAAEAGDSAGAASARAPGGRRAVSPRARAAARRLGADLATVSGTGPDGRIVEADVLRAAQAQPSTAPAASSQPAASIPLSKLRHLTAERMAESFRTAPHFYVSREIEVAELLALKRTYQVALQRRGLPALTLTDLLLKAVALGVADHPGMNANWIDGEVRPRSSVDIGLAVAVEDGLIAPVLRGLDGIEMTELVRLRQSVVERARAGRLRAGEVGGASATLSNLGMYGVDQFQAILNPPESVIVATGRVRDRVVAVNGAAVVRPTLFVTISADHRVVDGALAAKFLAGIAEALENPGLLLLPPAEAKP